MTWRRRAGGGGSVNFDFSTGVLDPRINFTRASSASYFDSTGTLQAANNNVPRFDYDPLSLAFKGFLIEDTRTNTIRNNTCQGAVAGTPGTLPTNVTVPNLVGLTQQITTISTENGITFLGIRFSGTPNATATITIQFETTGIIAAVNAQAWAYSLYLKFSAGSLTNVGQAALVLNQRDSGGTGLGNLSGPSFTIPATNLAASRALSGTLTTNQATIAFLTPQLQIGVTNGQAIDVTLRIGLPQLEQASFASSPIPTSGAAVTRQVDNASMPIPSYNVAEGTIYADFMLEGLTGGQQFPFQIDDNTNSNRILLQVFSDASIRGNQVVSGVATTTIVGPTAVANTLYKMAMGAAATNSKTAVNGTLFGPQTGNMPPVLSFLRFGISASTGALLFGWLKRAGYMPSRA